MTDRELQKLGRRELLQLLLEQARESERLGKQLAETEEQLRQTEEGYERLRDRLDSKDARIQELQDTLQAEREKRETDLENVGSIAEAALRLNGVFDAAQSAADYYLQSIQTLYPLPEGAELPPIPEVPPAQGSGSEQPASPPAAEQPAVQSAAESQAPSVQTPAPPARARRPFGLKTRQEKGKWTLFVGWQHD